MFGRRFYAVIAMTLVAVAAIFIIAYGIEQRRRRRAEERAGQFAVRNLIVETQKHLGVREDEE